jgi:hypothetical protein
MLPTNWSYDADATRPAAPVVFPRAKVHDAAVQAVVPEAITDITSVEELPGVGWS